MKRKMISVVAMMMVAALALGGCGKSGNEVDEEELEELMEDLDDAPAMEELNSTVGELSDVSAGTDQTASPEAEEKEEEEAVQYEADPLILASEWTDYIIQIDDMVFDHEETTVGEMMDIVEAAGRYTFDRERTSLASAQTWEKVYVKKDGKDYFTIWLFNPTDSAIPVEEAPAMYVEPLLKENNAEPNNVWYPTGMRADGAGMTFDEVKAYVEEPGRFSYMEEKSGSSGITFVAKPARHVRYHGYASCALQYEFEIDKDSGKCTVVKILYKNEKADKADSMEAYFTEVPVNPQNIFLQMPDRWEVGYRSAGMDGPDPFLRASEGRLVLIYRNDTDPNMICEYVLGGAYDTLEFDVCPEYDMNTRLVVFDKESGEVLIDQGAGTDKSAPFHVSVPVSGVNRLAFTTTSNNKNADNEIIYLEKGVLK